MTPPSLFLCLVKSLDDPYDSIKNRLHQKKDFLGVIKARFVLKAH